MTSASQEPGEVSVCNTVFTGQRGFLSRLPCPAAVGQSGAVLSGEWGEEMLGRFWGDSSNIPRGYVAKRTLEEVKGDVGLRFLN